MGPGWGWAVEAGVVPLGLVPKYMYRSHTATAYARQAPHPIEPDYHTPAPAGVGM